MLQGVAFSGGSLSLNNANATKLADMQHSYAKALETIGIVTHHDAITGTSLSIVIEDYMIKLRKAESLISGMIASHFDQYHSDLIKDYEEDQGWLSMD